MNGSGAMLALVTDAFGGRGGIAQYNRDFLSAASHAGSVSSITVLPRSALDAATVPENIQQARPRKWRVSYSIAALRTALFQPVDVLFCGHLLMAPLAALIARLKGAKLIVQTHGIEAWTKPSVLERAALEHADLVLCVSRHTRAAVLDGSASQPERVLVVPNTFRDVFTPGDGSALRAELRLQGKRVLLTVGRLDSRERYKGHDRVIAILPQLVAQGHDVVYVIIGEGDDRGRLETLANQTADEGRVRFLGGVGMDRLVDAYRMADLFVMPSTGEGFGIVYLEAMASGTRALGLNAGGARDALADGKLGLCVGQAELADAIDGALRAGKPDPEELSREVRTRFGNEAFAANVGGVLGRMREAFSGSFCNFQ